jgi:hypothetical protein
VACCIYIALCFVFILFFFTDKGIIPRVCEEMFNRIQKTDDTSISFKIEVSFMEIYNEKVRGHQIIIQQKSQEEFHILIFVIEQVKDLLNPKNNRSASGLKVRNHPTTGPYVEDLARLAVKSFHEVETLMDEGSKARTVASTNISILLFLFFKYFHFFLSSFFFLLSSLFSLIVFFFLSVFLIGATLFP